MKLEDKTWNEADDDRTVIRPAAGARSAPATDWAHSVIELSGTDAGRRHTVGPLPLTLGRKPPADILVPQAEVSAAHCRVQRAAGADALQVFDLNSTNGTFVDGRRVQGQADWPPGGLLQVGQHLFRHEYQPAALAEAANELERDLDKAGRYVQALLPPPIRNEVLVADSFFRPSARLGGDAFGYQALDEDRFAGYMIDVCGHGAGSAMHTVSVLNVVRQRALPRTDFADPAQVLERLNELFPMESHGELYFSIWYGVYDRRAQSLAFAAAGHHPAFLRSPDGATLQPLGTRNPLIGVMPGATYTAGRVAVPPGSRLYLFSDGAFETVAADGRPRGLQEFLPLLLAPPEPPLSEPERLYRRAIEQAAGAVLDDDFSAVTVTFLS